MAWAPPTERDFNELWLQPKEVADPALFPKDGNWHRWIYDRLLSDVVVAVARTMSEDRSPPQTMVRVPAALWQSFYLLDDHFWRVGDVTLRRYIGATEIDVRCLDVRFDPSTLKSVPTATSSDAQSPSIDRSGLPALSDAALTAWAALFVSVYPSGSEALARASVDGMFPDRHVTRERLRRVLPERRPGRPSNSK